MPHPLLSALQPVPSAPAGGRVSRLDNRAESPDLGPKVAVLITDCRDIAATVRCYRTVLPLASVYLYGSGLLPETIAAAETAGAMVVAVPPCGRTLLVRRMLAEVDADIYLLAHRATPEDACVAPLVVAEIDTGGRDFVDILHFGTGPAEDLGDRLLARTVDFLFGQGGETLASDAKACSRRFAISFRSAEPVSGSRNDSALDLALHALRLRLPIGSVASLGVPSRPSPQPARDLSGWLALLGLTMRLLVEERPRRVLGLLGLGIMAAGAVILTIHGWHAMTSRSTLPALALLTAGVVVGVAGAGLDSLAAARQEVKRVGVAAIPRRAERAQSSVS